MTIGGASVGLQIGGSSTDFVLLVMDQKVVTQMLSGKTKMGTDATATAGPSGATAAAATDAQVYSYGRAKGMFAGGLLAEPRCRPITMPTTASTATTPLPPRLCAETVFTQLRKVKP
jgi:hypothetical protein